MQEVDHNRIGDILRVRRKEKRYIESVNPPPLDPFETIRLWLWLFGPSLPLRLKERVRNDGDVCNLQMTPSPVSIFRILQKFFFHGLDNFLGILKCIVQTLRFGQTFGHTLTKNVLPTDQE